jgi:hypothetical protein
MKIGAAVPFIFIQSDSFLSVNRLQNSQPKLIFAAN